MDYKINYDNIGSAEHPLRAFVIKVSSLQQSIRGTPIQPPLPEDIDHIKLLGPLSDLEKLTFQNFGSVPDVAEDDSLMYKAFYTWGSGRETARIGIIEVGVDPTDIDVVDLYRDSIFINRFYLRETTPTTKSRYFKRN